MRTELFAWKVSDSGGKCVCPVDDKDAILFSLRYRGYIYAGETIDFTSRLLAEQVERAMLRMFEEGKKEAKAELAAWLRS